MSVPHEEIMAYFSVVPEATPQVKAIWESFQELARRVEMLPRCAERTAALRKLLEARDCAVRANMVK